MRRQYSITEGVLDPKYLLNETRWHPLENPITREDQVTESNSYRIPQHTNTDEMHPIYKKFRLGLLPKEVHVTFIFNASDLGTWLGLWLPRACSRFKCMKYATLDKVDEFLQLASGKKELKTGFQFEWGKKHENNAIYEFIQSSPYPVDVFEVGAKRYSIATGLYVSAAPDAICSHARATGTLMQKVKAGVEAKAMTPVIEKNGKQIVLPSRVPFQVPPHYYVCQMYAQMRAFLLHYTYFLSWTLENGQRNFLIERRDRLLDKMHYHLVFLYEHWIIPLRSQTPPLIDRSFKFDPFEKISKEHDELLDEIEHALNDGIIYKWHAKNTSFK